MLTQAQIDLRKSGLGGSEIGSALGFDEYRTPFELYLEKRGEKERDPENYRMWWGTGLEPFVLRTLVERPQYFVPSTQAPRELEERWQTLSHPKEPWMLATPDALAFLEDGRGVLLECKTAAVKRAEGWGDAGSSDIPTKYACQGLWTANVLRACGYRVDEIWVLCVFGNREPQRFVVPVDEGRIAWLVQEGRKFWFDNVLAGVPPVTSEEAA